MTRKLETWVARLPPPEYELPMQFKGLARGSERRRIIVKSTAVVICAWAFYGVTIWGGPTTLLLPTQAQHLYRD